jgi:cytochrome b
VQENLKRRNHKEFGYAGCRSPSVGPICSDISLAASNGRPRYWFMDEPLWMHTWLGYLAAGLVILRIVWGFIGPENAQFINFVRGPRLVLEYVAGLVRFSSRRYLGHSPAGGAMIVALLVMISATIVTGMANLAADRGEGPLAGAISKVERPIIPGQRRPRLLMKRVHQTVANITLVLVVLHALGVALGSFAHRENLVRAMITGRKRAE